MFKKQNIMPFKEMAVGDLFYINPYIYVKLKNKGGYLWLAEVYSTGLIFHEDTTPNDGIGDDIGMINIGRMSRLMENLK